MLARRAGARSAIWNRFDSSADFGGTTAESVVIRLLGMNLSVTGFQFPP
jgi:hypothetical protein